MDNKPSHPTLSGVFAPPPILTLVALAVGLIAQAIVPLYAPELITGWPLYAIGVLLLSSAITLIALAVRGHILRVSQRGA